MASEDEANLARREHGRALMQKGVHSIGVEEGKAHGRPGWVVVAHVAPEATVNLPSSLSSSTHGGSVAVPLVVRRSEPFALE